MKKIRVKEIQDKLEKLDYFELDFCNNVDFMITKDEIFVIRWDPHCPPIKEIPVWRPIYVDRFKRYEYKQLNLEDEVIDEIINEMFKECKYSICEDESKLYDWGD